MKKFMLPEFHLTKFSLIIFALSLNSLFTLNGQDTSGSDKWNFVVEPYIMFPNLAGKTGIRNLPDIELNKNTNDIFSHLQIGGMLNMEARKDNWAITTDLLYANLTQDATPTAIIVSGQASAKQFMWELAGFYRLTSFLEVGLGGRMNIIESGVDIVRNDLGNGETSQGASIKNTWVDPILIAAVASPVGEKWNMQFRGDIGGFNVGSKFTWQLQGFVGYHFSKLFMLSAGYRVNSINYDRGTGSERFRYDVRMFGPILKFGFNF
jgi:hypothetical protein